MRLVILSLAAALTAAVATPALANEGRIESHGGVIWLGGNSGGGFGGGGGEARVFKKGGGLAAGKSEGVAGVAAGYDWDLGDSAFVGVEVSGDKIIESGTRVSLGLGARVGAKLGENGRLYALTSYQSKPCNFCEGSVGLGAGYQHTLGGHLYGKVEYRHLLTSNGFPDSDAAVVGLGMNF